MRTSYFNLFICSQGRGRVAVRIAVQDGLQVLCDGVHLAVTIYSRTYIGGDGNRF